MSDYTYVSETQPIARKAYVCGLCELDIAKGERHVARVGVGNGAIHTFRMHTKCEALTHEWDEFGWEENDPAEFRLGLEAAAAIERSASGGDRG